MESTDIRATLLHEVHYAIDDATRAALRTLTDHDGVLTYPPGVVLTDEELGVLREFVMKPALRSALTKIIRDSASFPLFHLFTLLDAVGDPRDWHGPWLPLTIARAENDGDRPMWHDDFYESYWDYQDRRDAG